MKEAEDRKKFEEEWEALDDKNDKEKERLEKLRHFEGGTIAKGESHDTWLYTERAGNCRDREIILCSHDDACVVLKNRITNCWVKTHVALYYLD